MVDHGRAAADNSDTKALRSALKDEVNKNPSIAVEEMRFLKDNGLVFDVGNTQTDPNARVTLIDADTGKPRPYVFLEGGGNYSSLKVNSAVIGKIPLLATALKSLTDSMESDNKLECKNADDAGYVKERFAKALHPSCTTEARTDTANRVATGRKLLSLGN